MSTYSSNLRLELIGNGEQAGTWGTTTNNNLGTFLEGAICGYATVSVTSAHQALTANNGLADQARLSSLRLTTTTSATFNVYAPPVSKQYVVHNDTSYVATIYNSTVIGNTTAAGLGVAIPAGKRYCISTDGTNFYSVEAAVATTANNVTGVVAIANGGTGQTTQQAALNTLAGATTAARFLRGDGTNVTLSAIQASDVPTLNQNTTGTAANVTGTVAVANGGTGATTGATALVNLGERTGSTGSAKLPVGTSAQRDASPASGYIRFNSDITTFEGYNGSAWGSLAGATGGGADDVFYENGQTVTTDYTITSGKNAMSAGPIAINDSITVTVPDGSVWTVV